MMVRIPRKLHAVVLLALVVLAWYSWYASCPHGTHLPAMVPKNEHNVVYDREHTAYEYHRDMPLIFIGGIPRSGTTLMRAILDAHPDIRCGEETRVIPRMLGMRAQWMKSEKERTRLNEAGLTQDVLNSALAAFILEVIAKHGEPAKNLCSKDPFTLKSTVYLSRLFPNAKFILMIRDGRAVVHSVISRKITISGFDLKSFRQCLEKWNAGIETMYVQCLNVGSSRCLAVHYEQLVLHPRDTISKVVAFLGVDWDEALMHHSDYINVPGGVSLSNVERSTDQVIKPVNIEALTHWASHVPTDVKMDIQRIAPMLSRLGYDQHAYPPVYGKADDEVARNTHFIKEHKEYWAQRSSQIRNSSFVESDNSNVHSEKLSRIVSNATKV